MLSPRQDTPFQSPFSAQGGFLRTTALAAFATFTFAVVARAQQTTLESLSTLGIPASSDSAYPAISGDGRFLAWASADPTVVPNDTNGQADIFVRERATGITIRASVSTNGVEADGWSSAPQLSEDGRFVVFSSAATNLAGVDNNGAKHDVFLRDLVAGTTERISVTPAGVGGNELSYAPRITANGRFVLFHSVASDLVAGDTSGSDDVFVRDRVTGVTDGVSVTLGGAGQSNGAAVASISDDGRYVTFVGNVPGPFVTVLTVLLRDRMNGTSTPVAVSPILGTVFASWPVIAPDGSAVAFRTAANLVPQDQNVNVDDIYIYDVATGGLELGSADFATNDGGTASSWPGEFSADGRYLAFQSYASNLVPGDTNDTADVFVRDRALAKTIRASLGDQGQQAIGTSGGFALTSNGRAVAFVSEAANLVANDANGVTDVFVRELTSPALAIPYGVGFPGTAGIVPVLALLAPPALGSTPLLAIGNSSGAATLGVLIIGVAATALPTGAQGTLLVDPALVLPIGLGAGGAALPLAVPDDLTLAGTILFLQVIELDSGAAAGASFTAGLEVRLGD